MKSKHRLFVGMLILSSFSCSWFSWCSQKRQVDELSHAYMLSREEFELIATVPADCDISLSDALSVAKIPHEFDGSLATGFRVQKSNIERARIIIKEHGAQHHYKPFFGK